jgi:hypothetical protein
MDPEVAKLMAQSAAQGHMANMANISAAGQNLAQGLGVVNTAVIQAQASVSDDPGLVTAFQTAARSPDQGAIK